VEISGSQAFEVDKDFDFCLPIEIHHNPALASAATRYLQGSFQEVSGNCGGLENNSLHNSHAQPHMQNP